MNKVLSGLLEESSHFILCSGKNVSRHIEVRYEKNAFIQSHPLVDLGPVYGLWQYWTFCYSNTAG